MTIQHIDHQLKELSQRQAELDEELYLLQKKIEGLREQRQQLLAAQEDELWEELVEDQNNGLTLWEML